MFYRDYDPEKDRKACLRIWYEVGWLDDPDDKDDGVMFDLYINTGRALVADVNGEAECLVNSTQGTLRHLETTLTLSAVQGVTTSRVARKQGLAGRMTAQLVALDVADGAEVTGLGMFEQGFYNRLGFGTLGYEHFISFDPAQLHIERKPRVPHRITKDDWQAVYGAMLARRPVHGACNLTANVMQAEMLGTTNGFGLGYYDGPGGALSHCFWAKGGGAHGPYVIYFMIYQTWDQFLELMALLKHLGDQVRMVRMQEPPGIQLQDLIRQPFRYRQLTNKAEYENINRATAYMQMRICDLPACLAKTHLYGETVRFNLALHDPITAYLDDDAPWHGIGGDYRVTLGPDSSAEPGTDPGLPTLTASVGAFTRMWLGVKPPSGLAVTDELDGPPELLTALDRALLLPRPAIEWNF